MKLIYIHGANATAESFTYIRDNLKGEDIALEYHSSCGFEENLKVMVSLLKEEKDLFFIGHSLGGVYSYHLAHKLSHVTKGGITLATPYGGSKHAEIMKYVFPLNTLYKEIGPNSKPIVSMKGFSIPDNWLQVVATRGNNPWIHEQNDGVVTITSMKSIPGINTIELPINHYEILVSKRTLSIIRDTVERINT